MLTDYDNVICVSAETPRELVIQYNNGKAVSKYWKSAQEMVDAIQNDYYIQILPLKEEHMKTYSELEINKAQDHKDPSDHIIISHAITEHLPLISEDCQFEFYKEDREEEAVANLFYLLEKMGGLYHLNPGLFKNALDSYFFTN